MTEDSSMPPPIKEVEILSMHVGRKMGQLMLDLITEHGETGGPLRSELWLLLASEWCNSATDACVAPSDSKAALRKVARAYFDRENGVNRA